MSAQKCRHCGEWLMCRNCQSQITHAGEFCGSCGSPLAQLPSRPGTANALVHTAELTPGRQGELHYAGFWIRFVSLIVDGLVLAIPLAITAITFIGPILIVWLYVALMMSSSKQGTLGMMAMGLRVTNEQGERITFGQATGRYFASVLSALILYIGYLMLLGSRRKQTMHDRMAGTLILHGRGDLQMGWQDVGQLPRRQELGIEAAEENAQNSLRLCDSLIAQVEQESITLDLLPADAPVRQQYLRALQLRSDGASRLAHPRSPESISEADHVLNTAVVQLRAVRDALTHSIV